VSRSAGSGSGASPDVHTLTGAYAVDALPDDERRAFEAHLAECEACTQEVAELQITAAHLGAASAVAPPAGMKDAVLARIGEVRQEAPSPRVDELAQRRVSAGRRWSSRLLAPAAAIMAIAVIGLTATVIDLQGRLDRVEANSMQVSDVMAAADAQLVDIDTGGAASARLVVSSSRSEAVLLVDGMSAAPADHRFVIWLIDGEGTPLPAGSFEVDDRGRATRVLAGGLTTAAALGVTVEPEDQPIVAPSTDPVMLVELPTT
jgi:anti-sigma-K factor RskA